MLCSFAEYLLHGVPVGKPEAVLCVQGAQALDKGLIAELTAQHVKQHERLAVADRFCAGAVAGAERRQRQVLLLTHIVGVFLQHSAPVVNRLAALFLDQVIGQVAGQTLGPVAAVIVDIDTVAPPVMQDFVGIGRVQDKRETDDPRAEQGKGGHAVAGLPEVFHQGELAVGVGPDQIGVQPDIVAGGVEVLLRQRRVRFAQEHHGLHTLAGLPVFNEAAGDQVDLFLR